MTPARVTVVEVGPPRRPSQNEAAIVPTTAKVRFIEMLAAAGLPVVEATSFVHPAAVPQLADADQVLPAIARRPGVRYPVLVPNMRGMERAIAAGADAVAVFTAASEAFAQANIRMTIAESLEAFAPVLATARAAGMWTRGYVSTAFGCPYQGEVDPTAVADVAVALRELGCDQISIGDTIGVAEPDAVGRVLSPLLERLPAELLALRLHETRGRAIDNAEAVQLGITTFDASASGLGGCPFAPGAPGNLATETLVSWLHGLGIETGVDEALLLDASAYIRSQLGPTTRRSSRSPCARRRPGGRGRRSRSPGSCRPRPSPASPRRRRCACRPATASARGMMKNWLPLVFGPALAMASDAAARCAWS